MFTAALAFTSLTPVLCNITFAQPVEKDPSAGLTAEQVSSRRDSLLAELGLVRPLAASLRRDIDQLPPQTVERKTAAERLGALYAKLLQTSADAGERQRVETLARKLLDDVPEAATPQLQLTLLTAQYLPTEDVVERKRLMLTTPAEESDAQRVLRSTLPQFKNLAGKLQTTIRSFEERTERGTNSDEEMERLRQELRSLRDLRAEASFRAGWASYYLSSLSGDKQEASQSLEHFGVLLNAPPGRPATLDRLPTSLLATDAVAKAALGCALACSLSGNHIAAQRWLAVLQDAEDLAPAVATQLPRRSIAIFAAAGSWSSLELLLSRLRKPQAGGVVTPLPVAEARALAVVSLEALKSTEMGGGNLERAQDAAKVALGDLVTRGEVSQVVGLVKLYGSAIIGTDGFINNYVRALSAYEDARSAHRRVAPLSLHLPVRISQQASPPSPGDLDSTIAAYRFAAGLCRSSLLEADAASYPQQRTKAQMCFAFSLFYAGDLPAAAQAFEVTFAQAAPGPDRRDALFRAITTLTLEIDRATPGQPTPPARSAHRERLATLFISSFPHTREANQMLHAHLKSSKSLSAKDIEALLQISKDDPIYLAARGIAADGLYKTWGRASTPGQRDSTAAYFADVATDLLTFEYDQATGSLASDDPAKARDSALVAVNRARRIAEVLLAFTAPDVLRVQNVLTLLESIVAFHSLDITPYRDELSLRRFQVATLRLDTATADRELLRLRETKGPYLLAAEQFMYDVAVAGWANLPNDSAAAKRVAAAGTRLLLYPALGARRLASIQEKIAAAAAYIFASTGEVEYRELALSLDEKQAAVGMQTLATLRRTAAMREDAKKYDLAANAWLEILAAQGEGTDAWYEARYESIRLLALIDAVNASAIFAQFKSLHPSLGGKPWDEKFTELERKLIISTPPPTKGAG